MRLCHSVWTKPMQGHRWNIAGQLTANLFLFALSVAHAKRIGAEIVLHTDALGEEIYGFLPYDNIYRTLDHLNAHERFWAAGKIYAQEAEPLGSIHIDGDVFIKKRSLLEEMCRNNTDLVVQMVEGDSTPSCMGGCYEYNLNLVRRGLGLNSPQKFDYNQNSALNCGVVGFFNEELKKEYIGGYKLMMQQCTNDPSFFKQITADKNACPDIILEQWWLQSVADAGNYNVKTLLPGWYADNNKVAKEIGFMHVIGQQKYNEYHRARVKNDLKHINEKLYYQTLKMAQKYVNL